MSTHAEINWSTLSALCAEAGIGGEFADYEKSLPNLILTTIVEGTGTTQRYLNDPAFHANCDTLVLMIVAALTAKPHAKHTPADMEALNKIFQEEFNATRK